MVSSGVKLFVGIRWQVVLVLVPALYRPKSYGLAAEVHSFLYVTSADVMAVNLYWLRSFVFKSFLVRFDFLTEVWPNCTSHSNVSKAAINLKENVGSRNRFEEAQVQG